uniref:Uncharacterized protein n=1 Tax=Panagrolaimus sp. ES5 TaxID=591445 RepID=A0AC34FM51_9BILA
MSLRDKRPLFSGQKKRKIATIDEDAVIPPTEHVDYDETSGDYGQDYGRHQKVLLNYREYLSLFPSGSYIDILHGSTRKSITEPIVSLAMYTDGLKLSQSSSKELWLLGFTILDLPMKIRFSKSNFVYSAAWYSKSKPPWELFSDKIVDQINDGVLIQERFTPFHVLEINADMPARASLINCKQGGYCTCIRCNVKGIKSGKFIKFNKRNFQNISSSDYRNSLRKAIEDGETDCIKGPSAFSEVLKIPSCITGDIMHTGYYGPIRDDVIEILKIKEVKYSYDKVIEKLIFPHELRNRKLRLTSECSLYKASEWKAVILHVTVLVLTDFLYSDNIGIKNWEHLKLQCQNILEGVCALLCLMQDVVCEPSIVHSQMLLNKWFDGRKELFKHNEYTPKTHEIMHFPEQVRSHGPLQASSCFGGENLLQSIKNMVTCKSPQVILKQIAERSSQTIAVLEWRNQNKQGKFKSLIRSIDKKSDTLIQTILLPSTSVAAAFIKQNYNMDAGSGPKSFEINGYEYFAYGGIKNDSNDSICFFKDESGQKVGFIEYFIDIDGSTTLAQIRPIIVQPLNQAFAKDELLNTDKSFPFYGIVKSSTSSSPLIVEIKQIIKKAFKIEFLDIIYIVPVVHAFEHN